MKWIVIDANIYLSFYRLTTDDLDQLRKLKGLIGDGEITLYLTEQIRDEVRRNREAVIAESMKMAREAKRRAPLPYFVRNYKEYEEIDGALTRYEDTLEKVLQRANQDAIGGELAADLLLDELFACASLLPCDTPIVERAHQRTLRGNPPGKRGSLGDAITWEALLDRHPVGEDMCIISGDGDFSSPLAPETPHGFLRHEWDESKQSTIHLRRAMKPFFQDNYPTITLKSEIPKIIVLGDSDGNEAINSLINSGSFGQTHSAIRRIRNVEELTEHQAVAVADAAFNNDQISMIGSDDDVRAFYERLITSFEDALGSERIERLRYLISEV